MFTGPKNHRSRTARGQLRPGLALLIAGAFLVGAPALAGAEEGDATPDSHINITQENSTNQPPCSPGTMGLTNTVKSTAESFILTVRASAPPCEPIKATAAIYGMPGNGKAWPQRLVETKDFTIDSAGTTVIEFVKTCDAQQFDVLVGATPDVIDVTGPWHGPLLFPFDTATAEQYWGCVENTTTVPESSSTVPTTVTTVPEQSSVPPPEVLASTTVPVGVQNTTQVKSEVQAKNETRELAFTGNNSGVATVVGLAMLMLGAGMVLFSRRRHAEA